MLNIRAGGRMKNRIRIYEYGYGGILFSHSHMEPVL